MLHSRSGEVHQPGTTELQSKRQILWRLVTSSTISLQSFRRTKLVSRSVSTKNKPVLGQNLPTINSEMSQSFHSASSCTRTHAHMSMHSLRTNQVRCVVARSPSPRETKVKKPNEKNWRLDYEYLPCVKYTYLVLPSDLDQNTKHDTRYFPARFLK